MDKRTIIFSNSYSPRTGHNFVSEVLKIITNHEVLAHKRSETKISTVLDAFRTISDKMIYHKTDKDFMERLFVEKLRENILKESEAAFINIKDTSFLGIEELLHVFPKDIHILVLRHPHDTFSSLIKAMRLHNKKGIKNLLKRILLPLGIYPFLLSRKISNKVIKQSIDMERFYILRYEDLVLKNEDVLLELKHKFYCTKSLDQIKQEIDALEVINTSFFEETGAKHIWESKEKTSAFRPVGRKKLPFLVRKGIEMGSSKLVKHLTY